MTRVVVAAVIVVMFTWAVLRPIATSDTLAEF